MNALRTRRRFLQQSLSAATAVASAAACSGRWIQAAAAADWRPNYIVGSCMYGSIYLGDILPEVAKCGADALDIWPKPHGNQREQLTDLGEERFQQLLERHDVRLGCITQYKLGPFGLKDEMPLAQRLGCKTIVTGGEGPVGLTGGELKRAVAKFVEAMKPHLEVAEKTGVTIAIENHAKNLIDAPDSLRYLAELRPSPHLAIALAPYHLPQDTGLLAGLIRELGDSLAMFYAWQHGDGCMEKLPKEQELLQMPGRGPLDFAPLLSALIDIDYRGWTEIFMHPVPRGISILETPAQVTEEINRSRSYLTSLLERLPRR
ncbi:MAG: sugar phosphate isomerase/epimerase family protein [Aureliella sp.]